MRKRSHMQRTFAKHMAHTGDHEYAAAKAGYAFPAVAGGKLAKNPLVQALTRAEQQKFARDHAGGIAIVNLVSIASDQAQPAGARVQANKALLDMAGIGVQDGDKDRDPSEMNGDELHQALERMQRQQQALERALADRARPVIEADPGLFD